MSPISPEKDEPEVVSVIPVYPKGDDDDVVVHATILNENEEEQSNHRDDSEIPDAQCALEESVEVAVEDEDSSVACAVVVTADLESDSISKDHKSSQIVIKAMEEKNKKTPSSRTKSNKRKRIDTVPSVKDLGVPFRAIKRIMKVDPDIMTVQNEAAVVTTYALELFVQKIVDLSYTNAKKRGRNTVKYEDLAETRATNPCMNFLDTLLP